MDSWKMFDHDSVQWTEAVSDEVKDELFGNNRTPIVIKSDHPNSLAGYYSKNSEERTKMAEELAPSPCPEELAWATVNENTEKALNFIGKGPDKQRHIKLLTVVRGNNIFFQVWEGDNHVKEFKSGIGANEMAFFFEDMVIPFRDMFEELGFSVTEEVSCE